MMDASWLPVLAKAVSTALVVVIASSLAEALGPFWGGLIASLPVSTGPAYVFLAMQHDAAFVAASALSSCATNAATGLFLVVYAKAAGRRPPWVSLGTALATWLAASLVIRQATWTPATVVALNLVVYGAGFLLLSSRRINHPADRRTSATQDAPQTPSPTRRRWSDIPTRALAVAAFVSAVVIASTALGPQATGIATVFPISLTSLIVIVRPRIGGPASAHLASTALRAMLGFGLALLVLHLAIRPWGTTAALLTALLVSIAWSLGLLLLRGNSHKPPPRRPTNINTNPR